MAKGLGAQSQPCSVACSYTLERYINRAVVIRMLPIGEMEAIIKKITHLLEERIGLNPATLGNTLWPRIIKERMDLSGSTSPDEYYEKLITSSFEFQEFIELVVVPETWFFRDITALDFVAQIIYKLRTDSRNFPFFRILSVPCSSGEEPYSLAMLLLDAGLPVDSFHIDAIDISKRALEKAKQGIYGQRSFRVKNLDFQYDYFKKIGGGYQISSQVKRQVTFEHGNLCDSQFTEKFLFQNYNAIVCRNLFIYFNSSAQKKAALFFHRVLKDNGILVVSSAEIELIKKQGFASHPMIRACAFVKETARSNPPIAPPSFPQALEAKPIPPPAPPPPPLPPAKPTSLYEKAQFLADKGEFEEAIALCLESLKKEGVDPKVFFLLGVIQLALSQDQKAEEFFLKVAYLKPFHQDALFHLSLLAEKRGDIHQAKLYRDRSNRAQP